MLVLATITEARTFDQRLASHASGTHFLFSTLQDKRELGALTALTACDAVIPLPIDKARVMPHQLHRYPTSHALEVFAMAIKGTLASTSELPW